ncbi:MAG: DUF4350 domain-containing protein [Steroidobacteraceae bacterium]|nr:DUF4350 domain-containing protein [Steroidobacteraceae bacterium]
MRERGITLLLALAALAAFYAIWLRPAPSLDRGADGARPTTAERRGNGYAALFNWLQSSGIDAQSFRDRYTALPDTPARGNLLILSLPGVEVFRNDEFGALDKWIRRGNTLLINAALLDQPGWAMARTSGTVVEIESLTGIEFETREAREARLDPRPLSQRVREADARDAQKDEEGEEEDEGRPNFDAQTILGKSDQIMLASTGPHPLLAGVKSLALESDYPAESWLLRMPFDNFVLTLARTPAGEGALFEQRLGAGRIVLVAGGSMFTNRALGSADNARVMSNIVSTSVAPGGLVLFDDLRQGFSAQYDPTRFYRDSRLWRTVGILVALWLVWVLGSTRLRAPAIEIHAPSEAGLVRGAGGLISRTVAPHHTALRLFDHFFTHIARAARGLTGVARPDRGELWQWLERHAAILPQELDRLKDWYAQAHAERGVPLADLQNLLDNLERRLT